MSDATIQIEAIYGHTKYTPGDRISGKILWTSPRAVEEVVLRLFWFTTGRGTKDLEVVDEQVWPQAASQGEVEFVLQLPWEPFSFSGSLITLTWALEALLKPSNDSTMFEFFLSPAGEEILLDPVVNPVTGKNPNVSKMMEKHLKKTRR